MGTVARDDGQVEVRVDLSIAVAGKMLGRGKRAVFFDAAHIRFDEGRNPLRIFAERTHVDDGILGVAVYVRNGRENQMNANSPRFSRGNAADGKGVFGTAGRSDGHGMRKRRAILEPHGSAAFEIRRKEQRDARCFLQEIDQRRRRVWFTAFDSEGAGTRAQHESTDCGFARWRAATALYSGLSKDVNSPWNGSMTSCPSFSSRLIFASVRLIQDSAAAERRRRMVLPAVERAAGERRERGISRRAAGKRRKIRLRTGKRPVVCAACAGSGEFMNRKDCAASKSIKPRRIAAQEMRG